jgi:murein DD-endopeptidase MepM/ murein hydrolase activator NlpD
MAELDFGGLRAEIEAATMLPDFTHVARRARRARMRARLATLCAVLGVVGLIGPVGLFTAREHPVHQTGPITAPEKATPEPVGLQTPPAAPTPSTALQSTIVAADGTDLRHLYALVDVCAPDSCNLQLSMIQLTPQPGVGPDRIGLLRDKPTQWLTGFRVDALSANSLVVSAASANGTRRYLRVNTGNSADATTNALARVGDKVAAIDGSGELWAMGATSSQLSSLAHQPPVQQPTVAPVPPARGVWVIGTDPASKRLAVAVSQDAGRGWHSAALDLPTDAGPPVLASYNGRVAYVLARTADRQFALLRTTDSGVTWQRLSTTLPWPPADTGTGYGLVVRPDGSLLAWLETDPTVVYAQSTDGGHTFANVAGPGGPVIAVSDGYVSLGAPPKVSVDGSTWASATLPILAVAR